MIHILRKTLLGLGVAAAAAGFATAGAAAPIASGTVGLQSFAAEDVIAVRSERRARKAKRAYRHARRVGPVYGAAPLYYDDVGSIGHDGYGYGYNRFSGQRYFSCQIDEGYGRTRPCDAGGGGGGGGLN
jgi:hypothetical protein